MNICLMDEFPDLSRREELKEAAIAAIHDAQLSQIEHLELYCYVTNADRNSNFAIILSEPVAPDSKISEYILNQVSQAAANGSNAEDTLRSLLRELKELAQKFSRDSEVAADVDAALRERENGRCCVSGLADNLQATHIISPSILNDNDLKPGGRLRPLLEAVISADAASALFGYIESAYRDQENQLRNLWLMCPSVRSEFRNGAFVITRNQAEPSESPLWRVERIFSRGFTVSKSTIHEFYTEPHTPDETRLPLPGSFLLRLHSIFLLPLHFTEVKAQIGRWPIDKAYVVGKLGRRLLQCLFQAVPIRLRVAMYRLVLRAAEHWDPGSHPSIKFLPLGLCLKLGGKVRENEANALRLVEKYTTINAPRLVNFTRDHQRNEGFLLTTRILGTPADIYLYRMTYEEQRQLAKDLKLVVAQLRGIPNSNKPLICDTLGGPITDHRIGDWDICGPFDSKADFLDFLTEGVEHTRRDSPLYEKDHEVHFTHSDFHMSNLMLQGGRLSGIIDWENAGFKPEYWEFTRTVWACKGNLKLAKKMRLVFDEDYSEELEAERALWRLKPVF